MCPVYRAPGYGERWWAVGLTGSRGVPDGTVMRMASIYCAW